MKKRAVISVKLVDESLLNSNGTIAEELLRWFLEGLPAPWVRDVEYVLVQDVKGEAGLCIGSKSTPESCCLRNKQTSANHRVCGVL